MKLMSVVLGSILLLACDADDVSQDDGMLYIGWSSIERSSRVSECIMQLLYFPPPAPVVKIATTL